MSNFRYIIVWVLVMVCLSCNFGKHTFSFSEKDISSGFICHVPEIAMDMKPRIRLDIAKVHVYRTRFVVERQESETVIDYTVVPSVNGGMGRDSFGYFFSKFQDLYLLELELASGSRKPYIYFSAKYQPPSGPDTTGQCLGFGPGYFGYYDDDINRIHFTKRLQVKQCPQGFVLAEAGKRDFSFIIDGADAHRHISISKILIGDHNKIGGTKNVIYSFQKIYDAIAHIDFRYVTTINLKP